MKSFLLVLLVTVSAHASVGIYSTSPSLGTIVNRGLVKYTFVPFVNSVDETNVVVDFTAAPATIEKVSGFNFDCKSAGSTARCTRALFPKDTVGEIVLDVRIPASTPGGHINVIGTINSAAGVPAVWRSDVVVPSTFMVRNANSSGPDSFADAITQANAACLTRDPCEIEFEDAFTIAPTTPLPDITANHLIINANEQHVTIDGSALPDSPGLNVTGTVDLNISHLTIINCGGPGILLSLNQRTALRATIYESVLGPGNLRGIMAYGTAFLYLHENEISGNRLSGVWITNAYYPAVYKNKIEGNGATGVYFGPGSQFGAANDNEITSNRDFGVAVDPHAKWIEVRNNSMKNNGQLGLDYALDLMTPNVADDSARAVPNTPVITSATFDEFTGKTVIIGHVDLRKPADVGYYMPIVDVYSSSALDAYGMAQGEKELNPRSDWGNAVAINGATGDFAFTYNGDLTGQYVSATFTRMYSLGKGNPTPEYYENWQSTSEFSAPVRVR